MTYEKFWHGNWQVADVPPPAPRDEATTRRNMARIEAEED